MKKLSTLLIATGIITSVSPPALSAKNENKIYKEKDIFTTQINTIGSSNFTEANPKTLNSSKMLDHEDQKFFKEKKVYIVGGLFRLFNAIF